MHAWIFTAYYIKLKSSTKWHRRECHQVLVKKLSTKFETKTVISDKCWAGSDATLQSCIYFDENLIFIIGISKVSLVNSKLQIYHRTNLVKRSDVETRFWRTKPINFENFVHWLQWEKIHLPFELFAQKTTDNSLCAFFKRLKLWDKVM